MRATRRWAVLAGAAGLLLALGLWLRGQLEVDRCLDAGGRWNADAATCEGARPGG